MKRIAVATVMVAALLASAACSGSKGASSSAGGSSAGPGSSGGSAAQSGFLDSFPTVTPESANEKTVASKIDAYYASYVKYMKPQSGASNPLYARKAGQKGQFIGYTVTAYSPKDATGKYGNLPLVVTGEHVQTLGASQNAAELAFGANPAIDKSLGYRSTFNAKTADVKRTPESAGEKKAIEVAKAWVAKNATALGYSPDDLALTGYVLFWGDEPNADKTLYLNVQPDSDLVQSVWRG